MTELIDIDHSTGKHLLPNISIRLEFSKNNEAFYLLGVGALANKYQLVFDDLKIHLKSISVSQALTNAHLAALSKTNAIYPFIESRVDFASIPANLKQTTVKIPRFCFQCVTKPTYPL